MCRRCAKLLRGRIAVDAVRLAVETAASGGDVLSPADTLRRIADALDAADGMPTVEEIAQTAELKRAALDAQAVHEEHLP